MSHPDLERDPERDLERDLEPDLEPDREAASKPRVAEGAARSSRLARITISVASIDRARTFYEQIVGLGAKYELPGLLMLSTASQSITGPSITGQSITTQSTTGQSSSGTSTSGTSIEVLLHERTPTPGDAGIAASFAVDDVDAATEAAIALGANLIDAPADQPWGERQSVIHDIDGHVICLVAPIQPK